MRSDRWRLLDILEAIGNIRERMNPDEASFLEDKVNPI